ncbi:hypothetical protein PG994_004888 [Apiospora phragmitis]|uniref:Uncharacterized protein n=1 Tax=Apiospora phragmitis TaxID=2905665 RepID=A0ABR1VRV3_9PEZI
MFSSERIRSIRDLFRTADQRVTARGSCSEKVEKAASSQCSLCEKYSCGDSESSMTKPRKPRWHTMLPPYRFVLRLKQDRDSAKTIRATTRECPGSRCKVRIERNGGCPQMKSKTAVHRRGPKAGKSFRYASP